MKKIYVPFFAFVLLLLPFQVFGAVDITVKDNSTTDTESVSINVDTGTDTLEKVILSVETSEDVTITEVNTGTITCSSFDYSETNNIIKITCELESATALDGALANILFSATSSDYSFVILENSSMDIGDLDIGTIVNIGEIEEIVEDEEEDIAITETEPLLVSTEEDQTTDSSIFSTDNLTEYLPYVLIAGSVVLLISIIGILLSKRKSSSNVEESSTTEPSQSEPTLKDMVNQTETQEQQVENIATPSTESITPSQNSMTQTLNTPLQTPTPAPEQVTQQEVQTTTPIEQPPVSTGTEEQDMQEILNSEPTQAMPQQPVTETAPSEQNTSPVQETTPLTNIIPETPAPASPEELQNKINEEISQLNTATPTPEPSANPSTVIAPETVSSDSEELPPVPPTM